MVTPLEADEEPSSKSHPYSTPEELPQPDCTIDGLKNLVVFLE